MRAALMLLPLAFTLACSDKFEGDDLDVDSANGDGGDDGAADGTDGSDGTDGTEEDPSTIDADGDGFTPAQGDCDDTNSTIYPSAEEFCNNKDDDCDGDVDDPEDLAAGQGYLKFEDADGDGFGNPDVEDIACEFSDGWVEDDTDCDDTEPLAFPGGVEVNWDGVDQDCDGADFDLAGCLQRALDATVVDVEDGSPWSLTDFTGYYDLSFSVFGYPITATGMGVGMVTDQEATLSGHTASLLGSGESQTANFDASLAYNESGSPFTLTVGVNPTYYNYEFFGFSLGWLVESAIGLVYTLPDDFDGTISCNGYVDPKAADFDGTVELNVNPSARSVTAATSLSSNVTDLTEGDVTVSSLSGGTCGIDIADLLFSYMGIGSTYTFLNENLEAAGAELVGTYESRLEANIAAECSGS